MQVDTFLLTLLLFAINKASLTHSSGVLLGLPTLLHFFLSLGMVIASLELMFACVAMSFSQCLLLINPTNIISNNMLLNMNATRGPRIAAQRPTGCCSARLLGCGTRSPLYLIGNAASRRGLLRVGYFITLNGPLNGHPPSIILYFIQITNTN